MVSFRWPAAFRPEGGGTVTVQVGRAVRPNQKAAISISMIRR